MGFIIAISNTIETQSNILPINLAVTHIVSHMFSPRTMLQDADLVGKCLSLYLGPAASLSQFKLQTHSQKANVWTISHKYPGALGMWFTHPFPMVIPCFRTQVSKAAR